MSATPWPKQYFDSAGKPCDFYRKETSYNECGHPMDHPKMLPCVAGQMGGNAGPMPMAYYNPYLETRSGYLYSPAECGYFAKPCVQTQCGGNSKSCCKNVSPLPCKYLALDRHLNTLGNNAHVVTHDNARRLLWTYGRQYNVDGAALRPIFLNLDTWQEFRNADYTVGQLLEIMHGRLAKKPEQRAGGGAPFFIPNYGLNPNLSGDQMKECSQATTGFSYRFNVPPPCTLFGSQWGENLPSYNPVPSYR